MERKTVLVTGGLGYIGSHTVVELINDGFEVIIIENKYAKEWSSVWLKWYNDIHILSNSMFRKAIFTNKWTNLAVFCSNFVIDLIYHGSLEPNSWIPLPEKERSQPPQKQMDWLYARYQPAQPAYFYSLSYHFSYKIVKKINCCTKKDSLEIKMW